MTVNTEERAREDNAKRVRGVQDKGVAFVEACGGEVTLRAFRMYIETQERNDAAISRALTEPDSPLLWTRKPDGTPMVVLAP